MNAGSPFMAAILSGRLNTPEEWVEYLAAFHLDHPEANELFTLLLTPGGETSYQILARAAAGFSPTSVLDVGCGEGNLEDPLLALCPPTVRMTGIDLSARAVEIARGRHALEKGVHFDVGSAYALPYEDETFDLVVAHQMLNFARFPEDVLREAARVLRPGGHIVVASNRGWKKHRENTWIYLDIAAREAVQRLYPAFVWPAMGDARMYDDAAIASVFQAVDELDARTLKITEFTTGAFMSPQHLAAMYNRLYVYGSIPERSAIHDAVIARARDLADRRNLVEIELPFRLISVAKRS